MGLRIRVTVECISESDSGMIYSCCADYSSSGNMLIQSEVDDHTKAMASDALCVTSALLKNQIGKTKNENTKDTKSN